MSLNATFEVFKFATVVAVSWSFSKIYDHNAFHRFPHLPPEIRRMIWQHALPGPRVVEIDWCESSKQWYSPMNSRHPPSGLLRASKESHQIYHKYYTKICNQSRAAVGTGQPKPSDAQEPDIPSEPGIHHGDGHNGPACYFDTSVDTLYIRAHAELETILNLNPASLAILSTAKGLKGLRHLAIEYCEWRQDVEDYDNIGGAFVEKLLDLETFYLCLDINWADFAESQHVGRITHVDPVPTGIISFEVRPGPCDDSDTDANLLPLSMRSWNRTNKFRVFEVFRGGVVVDREEIWDWWRQVPAV